MNFCYIKNDPKPICRIVFKYPICRWLHNIPIKLLVKIQSPVSCKSGGHTSCHVAYASHGDQRNGRWTNVALNPPTRPFTSPLESQAEELSRARTNLVNAKREFQNNEKSLKELLHPLDEEENRMSRVEFRDVTCSPLGKRLVHECV